jgi:hypothetical protein
MTITAWNIRNQYKGTVSNLVARRQVIFKMDITIKENNVGSENNDNVQKQRTLRNRERKI